MTKSIVGKLTLFVGVLVGLNTALLIGAAYVATSAILRDQVRGRLTAIADDRQEILLHELRQQQARAATFGQWPRIRGLLAVDAEGKTAAERDAGQTRGFLDVIQSHTAGLTALWLEDEAGRVLAASDPRGLIAGLSGAEHRPTEAGADGWLAVPPTRISGLYVAVFCGAVRDEAGRRLGTACMAADIGPVVSFVGDPHGLGDTGEVLVGWKTGDRIHLPLPPRGEPALTEVAASEFPSLNAAISGEFRFARTIDYRDRDVLVAYRPLGMGFPNWGLIAKVDTAEAHEPVARLRRLLLAIGGGMLVLGLGASNAIARRFARPIKRLARTATAVAAGDLTVRSEDLSSDEIGGLGLAFNRMTEELERSYADLERRIAERTDALAHSELALREQTRILQSVLDCMGDGVVVADATGHFLIFNPAARRILGQDRVDAPPGEWSRQYEVYLPDRLTPFPSMDLPLTRAIRGESVDQAELYIAYPSREDGTWILVTGRPLMDERGTIEGGVVVFHDITRRKKAERRLAAQYETTRVLAEADSLGQAGPTILETIATQLDWDFGALWRVDLHAHRLRCAAVWREPGAELSPFEAMTWGIEPERGVPLPGRVWAEESPAWVPDIAGDPGFLRGPAAASAGLHAGFAVPIRLRGECLGVLEFFSREVRPVDRATLDMMASLGSQIGQFLQRQQMRTRVSQSERLASLGMLSAGVAHEINNPLAYIANNLAVLDRDSRFLLELLDLYQQGRAELAASRPDLVRRVDELAEHFGLDYVRENLGRLLNSTRRGVKRVADIVQNLRGFARLDRAEDQQADVHEAIRSALEMVRGRLDRRGIAVEEHFGEVPSVAGSPAQLNQVFLNLLVNALQAIEETHRPDGRIAITTGAVDGEVVVEVADNGCGIPGEVLPQIFDPFFTTKGVGDGTGLGLSITHGMVHDHGGRLEVESVFGEGTRFRVILAAAVPTPAKN